MATTDIAIKEPSAFALFRPGLKNVTASISAALEGEKLTFSDLDRVKTPAGGGTTWKIPSAEGDVKSDEIVGILAFLTSGRAYWEDDYSGQKNPPDCSSYDGKTGNGSPGGSCESCPLNEYESAKRGKGKACKEFKSLFVVMPGSLLPIVINCPPTSLKALKKYRLRLANTGLAPQHVVTRIGLTEAKNADGIEYSELVFSKGDELTEEQAAKMDAYTKSLRPVFVEAHAQAASSGDGYRAADDDPFDDAPGGEDPFER